MYVTLRTSRGVRTLFDQSEHSYGVRHGVYVRCFNQSERGYGVRHGVYVRCFNQSERGYGVRHGVHVTGCTSRCVRHGVYVRFLTNQSTGIAYVTGCTYAFRFDQSEHDILMRVRPLNMCAPPSRPPCAPLAPPCAPLKIRLDRYLYYYSQYTFEKNCNLWNKGNCIPLA